MEDWAGPTVGLAISEKVKYSCHCVESNPDSSVVTTATALCRLRLSSITTAEQLQRYKWILQNKFCYKRWSRGSSVSVGTGYRLVGGGAMGPLASSQQRPNRLCASSSLLYDMFNRNNSTKSPASSAGNISEPRLMSQVGRVHEIVCVDNGDPAVGAVTVRVFVCLRSSCNHVTGVGDP